MNQKVSQTRQVLVRNKNLKDILRTKMKENEDLKKLVLQNDANLRKALESKFLFVFDILSNYASSMCLK